MRRSGRPLVRLSLGRRLLRLGHRGEEGRDESLDTFLGRFVFGGRKADGEVVDEEVVRRGRRDREE
jgi:hypothetical protein